MLKGVTEENLKMGLFMKVRHSHSKKTGKLFLPAQAWKGHRKKILTNLMRAADVGERSLEDQNLWPSVAQCRRFQRWSWQRGSTSGDELPISLSSSPLISCCFFLLAKAFSGQEAPGLCDALSCWVEVSLLGTRAGLGRLGSGSRQQHWDQPPDT